MPQPLYPGVTAHRTHWIGGWVGPRAGVDTVVNRKNPITDPGSVGYKYLK